MPESFIFNHRFNGEVLSTAAADLYSCVYISGCSTLHAAFISTALMLQIDVVMK